MSSHPRRGVFRHTCRKLLTLAASLGLCAGILVIPARRTEAQVTVSSGVRISQIYTRGGELNSAFQNDFIEIFNGGTAPIDLQQWELHLSTTNGNVTTVGNVALFSLGGSLTLQPGRYLLVRFGPTGDGQMLPAPDVDLGFLGGFLNLGASGHVALVRRGGPQLPGLTCPQLPADGVEDFVGFGAGSCHEGNAPAPAPTVTESIKRAAQGCQDTNNNATDFALGAAAPRNGQTPANSCLVSNGASNIHFGLPQYFTSETDGRAQITVSRVGDLSTPAAVEYFTMDGTASERRDYTTAAGTLRFAPGEASKTFDVLVNGDAFVEDNETVNLVLLNPSGASLGPRPNAQLTIHDGPIFSPPPAGNPVDAATFFITQHYHDFLNRQPDEAGRTFWTQGIEDCTTPDCVRVKRVDASAAFFLSIEFQETGFFVYRLYRAVLPARELRPRAMPRYREFVRDTQAVSRGVIVGDGDWTTQLAANRRAFLEAFVARPEFQDNYPASLTPEQYVQKLNQQAGFVLSLEEAAALIGGLIAGNETRASVLGRVADDPDFVRRETNRAFVLMQYFGYLRRDPDAPGLDGQPDPNFEGYDFWLKKLDDNHGDFRAAEMVRAFIESIEYRQRFGQ